MRIVAVGTLMALVACDRSPTDDGNARRASEVPSSPRVAVEVEAARAKLDASAASRLEAALSDLDALCTPEYERATAMERLHARLAEVVGRIDAPSVLVALYWECDRGRAGRPDQHLSDTNVHFRARSDILMRLAELATEESAAALVELLGNEAADCDGEAALLFGTAITTCGASCLPHLERLRREDGPRARFAERLMACIHEGKVFGP